MSLYPDILFHFTNKVSLYEILSENFRPSYAREKIIGKNNYEEFAVPMVSFGDLRLSELGNLIKNYGKYGIGLTKEWANRNGLSPVIYINRHSYLMDGILTGISGIYSHLQGLSGEEFNYLGQSYKGILNSYRFIKNYEGELFRKGNLKNKNYRFADEREWRFVPQMNDDEFPSFVHLEKMKTSKDKIYYNKLLSGVKLNFVPEDIKYLIVENENEILNLIKHLENVKGRYDSNTRQRLMSRILTVDQINNDI